MHGVLLMYSVEDRATFTSLNAWLKEVRKEVPDAVIHLVGCKCDAGLVNKEVPTHEGLAYANSCSMSFHETSAKDGMNVDEVFDNLIKGLLYILRMHNIIYIYNIYIFLSLGHFVKRSKEKLGMHIW